MFRPVVVCAALVGASVSLAFVATPAQAQTKCATGTKRCGPVCIPAAESCNIKTLNGPAKRNKVRTPKGGTIERKTPKKTVSKETVAAPVRVKGCASHADLDAFTIDTAENILRANGWSMTPSQEKKSEGVDISMLEVNKDSMKGSVGIFNYTESSAATLFAYDMRRYTNTSVVQSPNYKKVFVVIVEGGNRAKALEMLQTTVQCTKKEEEQ